MESFLIWWSLVVAVVVVVEVLSVGVWARAVGGGLRETYPATRIDSCATKKDCLGNRVFDELVPVAI